VVVSANALFATAMLKNKSKLLMVALVTLAIVNPTANVVWAKKSLLRRALGVIVVILVLALIVDVMEKILLLLSKKFRDALVALIGLFITDMFIFIEYKFDNYNLFAVVFLPKKKVIFGLFVKIS